MLRQPLRERRQLRGPGGWQVQVCLSTRLHRVTLPSQRGRLPGLALPEQRDLRGPGGGVRVQLQAGLRGQIL